MSARQGEGIPELLQAVSEVAKGEVVGKPYRVKYASRELKKAVEQLTAQIESAFPGLPNARWVALRLLDGDERIAEALRKGELGDLTHGSIEARAAQLQVIGNQ
jgi:ferrous iron transport protein B